MQSVVIVGAGGFGREVLEIFKDLNKVSYAWNILGFIDENKELHNKIINGYPVLGGLEWFTQQKSDKFSCVVAIGMCEIRKEVVQRLEEIGVDFCNAIHPSVMMSEFVHLGRNVIICAGSILTVNIQIGDHVHINLNTTIGHDAVLGSFCTINPGVRINGYNHLAEGVYVGTGVTFIDRVSVGSWTTIGAGTVAIEDIPERVVAVGVPAKVTRRKV